MTLIIRTYFEEGDCSNCDREDVDVAVVEAIRAGGSFSDYGLHVCRSCAPSFAQSLRGTASTLVEFAHMGPV